MATGVAVSADPLPYRLEFRLSTRDPFVTSRLVVRTRGHDWDRRLDLRRERDGAWTADVDQRGDLPDAPAAGGELSGLEEAVDCDLAYSPLLNTLPILRTGILDNHEPAELTMAWIDVPSLAVTPSSQRYSYAAEGPGGTRVRFEGLDDGFSAVLECDEMGIVIDYPGLARLVAG